MADLAFGISKAAIQLLADKVKNAIKEEAEQWQTMERDLVFITGEFEMMQSFLDTATEERVRNKIVATWVRQVRNLSYDVEDNIESLLLLDTTKKRWWLRLLPSFGKSSAPLPLDLAVAKTAMLRARVVDVSQRNIRYNLIVDTASTPMAGMDLVSVQKTAVSSSDTLINAAKKSGLVDLAGLITRPDRDLHVVSICGSEGDLANVAIVRKMYNDSRIHKDFQCRAWVKLVHPFIPFEFIRSLMTQFLAHSCQEQVNIGPDGLKRMLQATKGDLVKEFAQKENNQSYIIVLEDLSTLAQWDAIRSYLPDRKKGSRIVVLTHHPVVASQCTGEPCRVSEIGQFSQGHSVRVYYKEASQHDRKHSFIKTESNHSFHYDDLLGRDTEMDKLFEQTQKRQESQFISVWGMPGIGKSSLVAAVYHKLRTTDVLFKRHVWVRVSHPFNPMDFCRSLLASLEGKYADAFRAEDPIKECQDYLRASVCLLVIDGVQSNEEWDWTKSNLTQYADSGSGIIIITTEESVAKHCAVSIHAVYNVKGLNPIAANELFQKVFQEKNNYHGWLPRKEVRLLLSKCGGHPRVIITVAEYLASKPRNMLQQEMMRLLSDNFFYVLATNPKFDSLRDIQAWMHSYLHACPRHLKKHMLYLSIFPPDIIVRRRRLIRRWVAEAYSKGIDSTSSEKYAEKMFDEVEALSFIEPVVDAGKDIGYRVNGLFREYVTSRPVEETIFFPVEVSALENEGQGCLTTEGIGQHLAIGSTWDYDETVFESLDFSRLRSLTLFKRKLQPFYVLGDRMRVLRVLDLEDAWQLSDENLEFILLQLKRLKFLSLRGHRQISTLPDSVGEVVPLQTLDIRDTAITTLPPSITKLRNLQYILAGTTVVWTDDEIISSSDAEGSTTSSTRSRGLASCLPKNFLTRGPVVVGSCSRGSVLVPNGIRRLEALHTLGVVHANTADGEDIWSDLYSLHKKLKKLQVSGINGIQEPFLDILHSTVRLESLSLQIEGNFDLHYLTVAASLRSLKMYGHADKLPPILGAANLAKLTLAITILFTEDVIWSLGLLPSLRTLRLRILKDPQDGVLQFPNYNLFSRLLVLEIACESMLHVRFDEGAMEKLEHLNVHCLRGSQMKVSGLEHLVSLKHVCLLGYFNKALKEAVQQQLDNHPKKIPAPKLEVGPPRLSEAARRQQRMYMLSTA